MTGFWDVHNHILPGLDDGASCLEETLEMLRQEYEQGVRHIIFTPHQRSGMFEIPEKYRLDIFEQVRRAVRGGEFADLHLHLGCEYHVHGADRGLLQKEAYRMPTSCIGQNIVLAEFAYGDELSEVMRHIEIIRDEGLHHIVIAHVERYKLSIEDIRFLHEIPGIYIQVNAGSITGDEGFLTKRKAVALLKAELIDLIGSDAHDLRRRRVNIGPCAKLIEKLAGRTAVQKLMISNPQLMFGDCQ